MSPRRGGQARLSARARALLLGAVGMSLLALLFLGARANDLLLFEASTPCLRAR